MADKIRVDHFVTQIRNCRLVRLKGFFLEFWGFKFNRLKCLLRIFPVKLRLMTLFLAPSRELQCPTRYLLRNLKNLQRGLGKVRTLQFCNNKMAILKLM